MNFIIYNNTVTINVQLIWISAVIDIGIMVFYNMHYNVLMCVTIYEAVVLLLQTSDKAQCEMIKIEWKIYIFMYFGKERINFVQTIKAINILAL